MNDLSNSLVPKQNAGSELEIGSKTPKDKKFDFSTLAFGFGAMTDQMSHQAFHFLVFTFYYAVVGVNVFQIAISFVIFAIWDSINDPLLGPISDRTQSRFGRRGFWILVSIVPFAFVNLLLFTVPNTGPKGKLAYMIAIIMAYDLFYTTFSTNQTSLFPEMFDTEKKRAKGNMYKNMMQIVGILIGFALPPIIISPMTPNESTPAREVKKEYITAGWIIGVFVIVMGLLFFKFGIKEKPSEETQPENMPKITEQLKAALKNKTFIIMVTANLFIWFVFKLLTTINPLYGIHVLGIQDGDFMLSVLLLVAFLSATFLFPVMKKIGLKYGMRNGIMISCGGWILALIPFWFFEEKVGAAIVGFGFMGFGLSGAMYYVDILFGQVIDEDELNTGYRRAGTFYGVNALINRYSTILVFAAIAGVLSGYGWEEYLIGASISQKAALQEGLKILFVGFSIGGLLLVLLLMYFFPLHGKYWKEIQRKLHKKRKNERRRRTKEPPEPSIKIN